MTFSRIPSRHLAALLAATIGLLLSTAACDTVLEEDSFSQVGNDYLGTQEGFDAALNGTYAALRSFYGQEHGLTLVTFGTDTYQQGADGSFKFFDSYTGQLNPSADPLSTVWNNMYIGINTANAVIGRSGNVEGLSEEQVAGRVAEARFLRAHYYFILTRLFGRVPVTLEETQQVETEASRAPLSEVYSTIISDLEAAIEVLPVTARDYGRATRPAAEHMLAQVLLRRGHSEVAQDGDFQRAATLAEKVINDYDFRLLEDFGAIFEMDNEVNDEVIWSVQYSQSPLLNESPEGVNEGNSAHLYFLMEYDVLAGMSRNIRDGRPWKRFRPTDFTLETLFADRVNDVRYDESFKRVFYTTDPGTYTVDGAEVELAEGDTAVWLPGYNMPVEEQQQYDYQVITPAEYVPTLYPTLTKHLDGERADINAVGGSRDFLVYRLGETHLIAAEALLMMGQTSEAVRHVNAVRLRAASDVEGAEANQRIDESDLDLNFLLDERGRELLGEQQRRFALTRTGTFLERVRAHNPYAADNVQDYHVLLPIPQDQVDRTTNEFEQNPGY